MKFLTIRKLLIPFKPILETLAEISCWVAARFARITHAILFYIQWGIEPIPEFFDHSIDKYFLWENLRNAQWLERGIYSILALKKKRVLELCCGDGFNAKYFYSLHSESVLSCDFDPKAIGVAKRKNPAPNVSHLIADIRTQMPEGTFENVIWDAAIEHFTEQEMAAILGNIKKRLTPGGLLSGYTIVELADGKKHLVHHEYEFKGKEDLLRILAPYFANVKVFETIYPGRHNLYFYASDGVVPFDEQWQSVTSSASVRT